MTVLFCLWLIIDGIILNVDDDDNDWNDAGDDYDYNQFNAVWIGWTFHRYVISYIIFFLEIIIAFQSPHFAVERKKYKWYMCAKVWVLAE